ncbi:MAG: protein-L-isoaspartate(D-aspartate) O-methyltransferase [Gammaproteobacteria bacterium]|jgi:protein-L-isoaspartate(D-aspartate) O-methyltransferase|nr:protein-L-isoaspartate(D-aspartate) O-methyltransferase [Gammaproteobacteria bacterium]
MAYRNLLLKDLKRNGITNQAVLDAISEVPREKFVLPAYKKRAYENTALPIDKEQTISQPFIVALMTQALLEHAHPHKILEIGTGSGYQTAILATLFEEVWTIERIEVLYTKAKQTLAKLGYNNIHYKLGDGTLGWNEHAPYDGIIVTAAALSPPRKLLEQLNPEGGLMVIPIGRPNQVQELTIISRNEGEFAKSVLELVTFVPLIPDHH